MTVGIKLPRRSGINLVAFGVRAESLGYESVWLGELWGENAFVELASLAERTSQVRLGTSIVNVYSRSPAVLAMSAYSLDRRSDGRFVLGVGVSTPKAIEDLHSLPFDRPIRRTEEVVELVRAFTSGEGAVDYDGVLFDVADFPALSGNVQIYNAALGPKNRRVTGQLCDGWLPHNIPLSNLQASFEQVAAAALEAGRDPDAVEVAPWIHVAAANDADAAREAVRRTVAYYVGSSDGYKNAVGAVFPDQAARIARTWRAGDRDDARRAVTDELVSDLGCAGTVDDVREQFAAVVENPEIDLPIVSVPRNLDLDAVERTVEAVAPENN